MADFSDHISQAKKNLTVLSEISQKISNSWDWQVTTGYYTAVHLMNAHLAKQADLHYKTHKDVKLALFDERAAWKIPDDIYTSYVKLENLSRRARYLCHEDQKGDVGHSFPTYDRHLKKALSHLDKILSYFSDVYVISFSKTKVDCIEISNVKLLNFIHEQSVKAA